MFCLCVCVFFIYNVEIKTHSFTYIRWTHWLLSELCKMEEDISKRILENNAQQTRTVTGNSLITNPIRADENVVKYTFLVLILPR